MEKRLFLAILISFAFLTLWSKVVAPPAVHKEVVKKHPLPAPEIVSASIHPDINQKTTPPPLPVEKKADFQEKITILENSKLKVAFTNIGGVIKDIKLKEYNVTLPVTNCGSIDQFTDKEFSAQESSAGQIVFEYFGDGQKLQKIYKLSDGYFLDGKIIGKVPGAINMYTLDISRLDKINDRDKSLFEYSIAFDNQIVRKSNAFQFEQKENKKENKSIQWFGFRDRYYAFVINPQFESSEYSLKVFNNKLISFSIVPRETLNTDEINFAMYFGPQLQEMMNQSGHNFGKIIAYSNWGIIDGPAKVIYSMLLFTHKFIHSWGISIILLGIIIYLITYPLTLAGMSSMRKMQSLQPQMTKLREQYKNNPQKLNQEMMELYKKHKVNPMGGCLPMIIQMPIFIGLYQILWRSVVLKGQGFLWIKDLSEPDRMVVLGQNLPLIGNEVNALPFLMAIVMFFQQKFSMKAMGTPDPAQQSQQKMMLWMLPIMMLFIFYKAASGLTLYFTVLYIMTTITQWKIAKQNGQEKQP